MTYSHFSSGKICAQLCGGKKAVMLRSLCSSFTAISKGKDSVQEKAIIDIYIYDFIKVIRIYGVAQIVKNPPAMQETQIWFLNLKDPKEGMAIHSSILAWGIP